MSTNNPGQQLDGNDLLHLLQQKAKAAVATVQALLQNLKAHQASRQELQEALENHLLGDGKLAETGEYAQLWAELKEMEAVEAAIVEDLEKLPGADQLTVRGRAKLAEGRTPAETKQRRDNTEGFYFPRR